jgi:hypothetical protein
MPYRWGIPQTADTNVIERIAGLACDVLVFVGAVSIAYGTWLFSHPLGFVAGGVLGIGLAVLAAGGAEQ